MKTSVLILILLIQLVIPVKIHAQYHNLSSHNHYGYYHHNDCHYIIIDSAYFKRMDDLKQQKFEAEKKNIDLAYHYLDNVNIDMAFFYARKTVSFKEFYPDRYIILTLCSAYQGDKRALKMYRKRLMGFCDPDKVAEINKRVNEIITTDKNRKS